MPSMEQTSRIIEYGFNSELLAQIRGEQSKAAIAREIGVSRQLWDYYESGGCPSVPVLAKMLTRFNLSFHDLVKPLAVKRVANKGRQEE